MTTKIKVVATTNLEALKKGIEVLNQFTANVIEDSSCKTIDHLMKDMNNDQVARLLYDMNGVMLFVDHFIQHCNHHFDKNNLGIEIVTPFTQPKSNNIH